MKVCSAATQQHAAAAHESTREHTAAPARIAESPTCGLVRQHRRQRKKPINQNHETAESTVLSAPEEQGILIVADREF